MLVNDAKWSISEDGDGEGKTLSGFLPLQFIAYGTFGGGTVKLQSSPDGGSTWYDIDGVYLVQNGAKAPIYISGGEFLRPSLSGSTSPSLTIELKEVGG